MKKKKVEIGITVCSMQLKSIVEDAVKEVYLNNKEILDKEVQIGSSAEDSFNVSFGLNKILEEFGITYYALERATYIYLFNTMNLSSLAMIKHTPITIVMDHIECIFRKLMPTYAFSDDAYLVIKDKELARKYCRDVFKIVKEKVFQSILKPIQPKEKQDSSITDEERATLKLKRLINSNYEIQDN